MVDRQTEKAGILYTALYFLRIRGMEWNGRLTILYCTVLYCTVLYCTVLYCTVLYCTVLYIR